MGIHYDITGSVAYIYASLALGTYRNAKCYLHVIIEHIASAMAVVLLTEPHGGSSTFRSQLCVGPSQWEKVHSMCAEPRLFVEHYHVPVTVDCSVADRFLTEPCGGSNSKERLQETAKQNR